MENRQDHKLNRYIFLGIIVIFALFLFASLLEFFTAFLGAIMFYVLSKSSVLYLVRKKRWNKSLAATLVIFISFFIILLPIFFMVTMIYQKVAMVAANPDVVMEPLKKLDVFVQDKFHTSLISPEHISELQAYAADFFTTALNFGFKFFTTISMMYFFLYFMLMHIGRMEAAIVFYLPFKRNKIQIFGDELVAQTFSNAVGVPLIAVVHGILATLGYYICGINEPGFWGVLTGFASVIPLVGTSLIWAPIMVYLFANGHTWQGFFLLAWGIIVIGLSDNVIRFLLAKKMADVHPIVTVLGVIMGLKFFGITGLIFGPLIISYFLILLKIYYIEYQKPSIEKKRTLFPSYFQLPFMPQQQKAKKK